jgi:hypothetical protein
MRESRIPAIWVAAVIVAVVVFIMFITRANERVISLGTGVIALVLLWLGYYYWGRNTKFGDGGFLGLGQLVEGADGRPSTSKLQFVLWTGVVVFSWIAIYTSRVRHGNWLAVPDLPQNVLIAMGLSVATVTAAKGITVGYLMSQGQFKTSVDPAKSSPSAVFQDDTGFPDLSKIQMLAWTLIAIATYFVTVWQQVGQIGQGTLACSASPSPCGLPDIDGALMVLMGLGQGAYLGKKLIMTNPATQLLKMAPLSGKPTDIVTVYGLSFGAKQNDSVITLDGLPLAADSKSWADTKISFAIPEAHPSGESWKPSQDVNVGVSVGGQDSVNTLPLTVKTASDSAPGSNGASADGKSVVAAAQDSAAT